MDLDRYDDPTPGFVLPLPLKTKVRKHGESHIPKADEDRTVEIGESVCEERRSA